MLRPSAGIKRSAFRVALLALPAMGCAQWSAAPMQSCDEGAVRLALLARPAPPDSCVREGSVRFRLTIAPEAAGTNPSPWYAFDIISTRSTDVAVTLDYAEAGHRYLPKRQQADGSWRPMPDVPSIAAQGDQVAVFRLAVDPGQTRIAAQEVIPPAMWAEKYRALAARHGLQTTVIGQSRDGQPILAITAGTAPPPAPLIILIGGQHPPEVPGQLAMYAFVERLLGGVPGGHEKLKSVRLLIMPLLNPDGMVRGHWRGNAAGVDINRDWGPFAEPETQAARDAIADAVASGFEASVLVDFHATRRDVFYTPTDEAGLAPADFSRDWLSCLDQLFDGTMPDRSASMNPGLPTAKSWFADTYRAPGITFELGDETDRTRINELARAAADALLGVIDQDSPATACKS